MPKFTVHVLAAYRFKMEEIEAVDEAAANEIAASVFINQENHIPQLSEHKAIKITPCGWNEEFAGFLVDHPGDEEFSKSRFFEADGTTPAIPDSVKLAAPELLAACRHVLRRLECAQLCGGQERRMLKDAIAKSGG